MLGLIGKICRRHRLCSFDSSVQCSRCARSNDLQSPLPAALPTASSRFALLIRCRVVGSSRSRPLPVLRLRIWEELSCCSWVSTPIRCPDTTERPAGDLPRHSPADPNPPQFPSGTRDSFASPRVLHWKRVNWIPRRARDLRCFSASRPAHPSPPIRELLPNGSVLEVLSRRCPIMQRNHRVSSPHH